MSEYHREECTRIWQQLGCEDKDDKVGVAAIVRHARYLERAFPDILDRYSEVAVKGAVPWDAFEALYLGTPLQPAGGADGKTRRQLSTPELRRLFEALDQDNSGSITLGDVVRERDLVQEHLPEMLAKWPEIDADGSGAISWDEFRLYFGSVDDWLEYQLGEIVGMDELKAQIRRFYRGVVLDQARRKKGHNVVADIGKYHMIFQGSPGTGKTSMARLMAKLMHRVGLLPSERVSEAQRDQLVAGYVGQTAAKTQKIIDEAKGGLLFIDEAYRLSQGKEDFGKEAIEQLMAVMNEPPSVAPIMIFAGYTADMRTFMAQNDGLYRRIPYTFDFANYTCSEIAEILELMVAKSGFTVERRLLDNGRQRLAGVLEGETTQRMRSLTNGGLCERIFAFAKQALDARDDPEHPSVELVEEDVVAACRQIPPPPAAVGPTAAGPEADSEEGSRDTGKAKAEPEEPELAARLQRLQEELGKVRKENAQLRREAAQGSSQDVLRATFQAPGQAAPNATLLQAPGAATAANATVLNLGSAPEIQGLQEVIRELRRVRAELQGREEEVGHLQSEVRFRDERVRQLEKENKALKENLQAVRNDFTAFPPGTLVQYLSASVNKWIDGKVQSYDPITNTYDLDVKKSAPADRIRAMPREEEEEPAEIGLQSSRPSSRQPAPRPSSRQPAPRPSSREPADTFQRQRRNQSPARAVKFDSDGGGAGRAAEKDPQEEEEEEEDRKAAEKVAAHFRRIDHNGDGVLDRRELAQVLQSLDAAAWPDERVAKVVAALDKNEDGRIQYQEFVDWVFKAGWAYNVSRTDERAQMTEITALKPEEKALWRAMQRLPKDRS